MGLFDRREGGFMDKANQWMTPERAAAFSAVGQGFSQMSRGQPADLSNAHNALVARQQRAEQKRQLDASGVLDKLTPDQRALINVMPPQAAQKALAEAMFGPQAQPKRYTVGGALVDGAGNVIYKDAAAAGTKPTAPEAEIARLLELGYSREEAIRVVDLYAISRDPTTGEATLINKATGKEVSPRASAGQMPASEATDIAPVITPDIQMTPIPDADSAFGLEGFGKNALNIVADVFGSEPPYPDTQAAIADFNVLGEQITATIAEGYGRQPPSWLLKGIAELSPTAGSPLQGPSSAMARMDALMRNTDNDLAALKRESRRKMSPKTRESIEARAASLRKVKDLLANARGSFGADPQAAQQSGATASGFKWEVVE